jgi:hypothetical protein
MVWVVLIHDSVNGCRVHSEAYQNQTDANRMALKFNRAGHQVEVLPVSINSWGDFDSQSFWFGKD